MTPDAEAIARSLTEAQRNAVCALPLLVDGRGLAEPKTKTVRRALNELGLTGTYSAAYDRLTPLGLAVRDALERMW